MCAALSLGPNVAKLLRQRIDRPVARATESGESLGGRQPTIRPGCPAQSLGGFLAASLFGGAALGSRKRVSCKLIRQLL